MLVRKSGVRGLRTSAREGDVEFVLSGDSLATLLALGEEAEAVLREVVDGIVAAVEKAAA